MNRMVNLILGAGVLVASMGAKAEDAKVIMTCNNGEEVLQVIQESGGDYGYIAQRFAKPRCLPFTECQAGEVYESHGYANLQSFQNKSTGVFSGEGVRGFYACGLYVFVDNIQRTAFAFRRSECVLQEHSVSDY